MPDKIDMQLQPPTHATYDISNIICAELVAEDLYETMTPDQRRRFITVLKFLDFEVLIKGKPNE